jgi:hypothetical protein
VIEHLVYVVGKPCAVVDTLGLYSEAAMRLVEKRVAFLAAIGDAGEGMRLAFDAQAGVPSRHGTAPGAR